MHRTVIGKDQAGGGVGLEDHQRSVRSQNEIELFGASEIFEIS